MKGCLLLGTILPHPENAHLYLPRLRDVFQSPVLEEVSLNLARVAIGFCLLRGLPLFFISKPLRSVQCGADKRHNDTFGGQETEENE